LQSFQINGIDIEIIFAHIKAVTINKSKSIQLTSRPSSGKLLTWMWLLLSLTSILNDVSAEMFYALPQQVGDTVVPVADSLKTTGVIIDSTLDEKSHTKIDAKVERSARDSIVQDILSKKVFLYGDAEIKYEDIDLKAACIEVDFNSNTVTAYGIVDSTGKLQGRPVFKQGEQTFKADTIQYNINTGKGYIYSIYTEDSQGYLAGEKVKKLPDNSINLLHGSYTTCNIEDHPHFRFKFKSY